MSQRDLTPRERQILESAATGADCADTAKELGLATGTVKKLRYNAMCKLGADNTIQAVAMAMRRGLIQ